MRAVGLNMLYVGRSLRLDLWRAVLGVRHLSIRPLFEWCGLTEFAADCVGALYSVSCRWLIGQDGIVLVEYALR